MKMLICIISAFVRWLRRPQRLIQKLKAVYPRYAALPFHTQAEIAASQGVEIVETPLPPTIEGATTRDGEYVVMAIRQGLNPLNRQFVVAHELGHVHLHLPELQESDPHPATAQRDYRDIEADAYALALLVGSLPKERLAPEVLLYVLNTRGMAWRAFRVICYLAWYHERIRLANRLERALLGLEAEGMA